MLERPWPDESSLAKATRGPRTFKHSRRLHHKRELPKVLTGRKYLHQTVTVMGSPFVVWMGVLTDGPAHAPDELR